jgi:hypothetical protein
MPGASAGKTAAIPGVAARLLGRASHLRAGFFFENGRENLSGHQRVTMG